jgi:hypothetical protein
MIEQNALNFYQNNKDCTWQLESIPEGVTSDLEIVDWLLNKSSFGWLELDINIDLASWQLEAQQAVPCFVAHREDNNIGWNSCCIHGIDINKTGAWTNYGYTSETDVPYKWTALSEYTPLIANFWKNTFPSEQYRRIRFMELTANSAITPHSDMPGRLPGEDNFNALNFGIPINIAVVHPKDCYMVLDKKGIVPFKEGKAFIVNIRHTHSVINFSNNSRIHVIGHSYGYGAKLEEFAELVVRSYKKQYERNRI